QGWRDYPEHDQALRPDPRPRRHPRRQLVRTPGVRQENHPGQSPFRPAEEDRRSHRGFRRRREPGARRDPGRAGMTARSVKGTTPEGAATEREASQFVRSMFDRIVPRYDLANHLLSFNLDRYWRARTVAAVRHAAPKVLDLCCGTGDLLLALEADRRAPVWGSDFCHPM